MSKEVKNELFDAVIDALDKKIEKQKKNGKGKVWGYIGLKFPEEKIEKDIDDEVIERI